MSLQRLQDPVAESGWGSIHHSGGGGCHQLRLSQTRPAQGLCRARQPSGVDADRLKRHLSQTRNMETVEDGGRIWGLWTLMMNIVLKLL